MAFRFFRRKKLFPGVWLNLSKSGASVSFGARGAKVTVGPKGVRKTVGIPGTGAYWTEHSSYRKRQRGRSAVPPAPTVRPEDRLSLGFFDRLLTPQNEEHFVDGMKQFVLGNEDAALRHLRKAADLADASFLAGILLLKRQRLRDAEQALLAAKRNPARLGHYFDKYGTAASISLPITEEVAAIIGPEPRGLLLALAELHQQQGRSRDAVEDLKQLYRRNSDDVVVRLALAELLVEEFANKKNLRTTLRLVEGVENRSEIHAALLLYKAKALRMLGLPTAARETLTATLRRKKDRSDQLLRALRYERALVYEQLGWKKRYRRALEKLYADDMDYEDVAARLFGS